MNLKKEGILKSLHALHQADTDDFLELVKISGLDPTQDFIGADLSNIDFKGLDLRSFNLTNATLAGADARGTDLRGTGYLSEDARIDNLLLDKSSKININHEEKNYLESIQYNFNTEMSLLGAILVNNSALEQVQDFLLPEHFADPAHGLIYAACSHLIERGQIATPVTLKNYFRDDAELKEIGGPAYIAELANAVITIQNARDLGREVYEYFLQRESWITGSEISDLEYGYLDFKSAIIEAIDNATVNYMGKSISGVKSRRKPYVYVGEEAAKVRQEMHRAPLKTGFFELDGILHGLHGSDLIILAGRPSMGKTAFATNIAYNAASSKTRVEGADGVEFDQYETVAFFSLEMSAEQLATRIISEQAHVRSDSIRRGDVREEEYNRVFAVSQALHGLKLFIDDTPALTVGQIRTRSRRLKRQHGLSLIIIDYLQLINPPPGSRGDNRVQEVSQITRGLKALAKELDVPVIALLKISRAVEQREDKRPQLSDLRESGSIEQDADVVMFLYREEYYREREKPTPRDSEKTETYLEREQRYLELLEKCRNQAEVIIAKQRHGPLGTVKLLFDGDYNRFADLAEDDHLPEDGF